MSKLSETMTSMLGSVDSVLNSKTVIGEPKEVGDTVIIPLVDISFGIAAGDNSADKKSGEGGGITGKMSPCAVLVIKDGRSKVINIKNQEVLSKLIDMVPDVLDRFAAKKADMMDDEEAKDIAFPEGEED